MSLGHAAAAEDIVHDSGLVVVEEHEEQLDVGGCHVGIADDLLL